jgi:hypothetical protein
MERYIQTDRQSDMVFFFLRMRLLASPFGLAIISANTRIYSNHLLCSKIDLLYPVIIVVFII